MAKGKRFFQISNAVKYPPKSKRDLAMKWLHNIGTGHTMDKFNFQRKMVCEDHFASDAFKDDIQNRVLGLPERKILKEDAVPTLFTHRQLKTILSASVATRGERSKKRQEQNVCGRLFQNFIMVLNDRCQQCFHLSGYSTREKEKALVESSACCC